MNYMKTEELIKPAVDEMIENRRHIHQHPELANTEFETTKFVEEKLREYGNIEIADIGMKTGVVALLRGAKPGRTIAIREDMDALPMTEATGLPFASENPGVCHACGHDMHTAILLAAAKVLSGIKDELCGNVLFLFQPAEEGGGGAQQLVDREFYKVAKPDLFIGCHVGPRSPVGQISLIRGAASASSDKFTITVKGKGGHGAHPEVFVDPIVASAYIITALQTVLSRENHPMTPAVMSIGSIHAGKANNVIPEECVMIGTLRNLDPDARENNKKAMERIADETAKAFRCTATLEWAGAGAPVRMHGDEAVDLVYEAAKDVIGVENINWSPNPSMGSEDFGVLFPRFAPGMQFGLGSRTDDERTCIGAHNPRNIFDEGCLPVGLAVIVEAVRKYLV